MDDDWSAQVGQIYADALEKLGGNETPLHYGPAHVVWDDGNLDSAEWCLENFEEYEGNISKTDAAIVRQSLERLARIPLEKRWGNAVFPLSVSAGSMTASGAVVWTCVSGWQPDTTMMLEVATDPGMVNLVYQHSFASEMFSEARAYTLKHDLHGLLNPSIRYYYRFTYLEEPSPVGSFRTLPASGHQPYMARFAVVTCNHYQQGYWQTYRHISQEQPDFVLHLGDLIYDSVSPLALPGRELLLPDGVTEDGVTFYPASLQDFRYLWQMYRSDLDLQAACEATGWLVLWDDHEEANDRYVSDMGVPTSPTHPWRHDPQLMAQLHAWAMQAWFEFTPTRPGDQYRSVAWGDLMELMLLDQRTWRSPHPCGPTFRDRVYTIGCEQMHNPEQTMHGAMQMQWLMSRLAGTTALWPILCSPTMVTDLLVPATGGPRRLKLDGRSGYQWEWWQILNAMPANMQTLSGDLHAFLAGDLLNEQGAVVSKERMTPSVSSYPIGKEVLTAIGLPEATHEAMVKAVNPTVSRFDGYTNGYLMVTVGRAQYMTELWECDPLTPDTWPVMTWQDVVQRGVG